MLAAERRSVGRQGITIQTGYLETIAEISVAFAGFAGIVGVFGRSALPPEVRVWRVRTMILTSLLTLCGALLPILLGQFAISVEAVWRSCGLFLAVITFVQLAAVAKSRPAAVPLRPKLRQPMTVILLVLTCSSGLLQLSVSAGAFSDAAPALYSCSVSYLLFLSAFHFFRLIQAVQTV